MLTYKGSSLGATEVAFTKMSMTNSDNLMIYCIQVSYHSSAFSGLI